MNHTLSNYICHPSQPRRRSTADNALGPDSSPSAPSNTIHLFWDNESLLLNGEPADTTIILGPIEIVALLCSIRAGMQLSLWSYHSLQNCPKGVTLCNAEDLLSSAKAQLYLTHKFTIHHIADLVRFLAIAKYPGSGRTEASHVLAPTSLPQTAKTLLNVEPLGSA